MDAMLEKLRELRKERGWSQTQIGEMLDLQQQHYSQYETGTVELPLRHFEKLVEIFDVSADYLLGRTERAHGKSFHNVRATMKLSCEELMDLILSLSEAGREDVAEFVQFLRLKERKENES